MVIGFFKAGICWIAGGVGTPFGIDGFALGVGFGVGVALTVDVGLAVGVGVGLGSLPQVNVTCCPDLSGVQLLFDPGLPHLTKMVALGFSVTVDAGADDVHPTVMLCP